MATLVSSTAWVQRGRAAPFPAKYELVEKEYARIISLGALELQDAQEGYQEAQQQDEQGTGGEDELTEYNLETYSDSEEDTEEGRSSGCAVLIPQLLACLAIHPIWPSTSPTTTTPTYH